MAFEPSKLQRTSNTSMGLAGESPPADWTYGPTTDAEIGTGGIFLAAPDIDTASLAYSIYFTREQTPNGADGGQGFSSLKDLQITPGSSFRIFYSAGADQTSTGRKKLTMREYIYQGTATTGTNKGRAVFTRIR